MDAALTAVAEAAGARLRAETEEDGHAGESAAAALLSAATSAMGSGHSLTDIAEAETRGKGDTRHELGAEALKRVERTGRQAREAEAEHQRAIARAMRLGLATRQIAFAAGVTHGTIRAISNRTANVSAQADVVENNPSRQESQVEQSGWTSPIGQDGDDEPGFQ